MGWTLGLWSVLVAQQRQALLNTKGDIMTFSLNLPLDIISKTMLAHDSIPGQSSLILNLDLFEM